MGRYCFNKFKTIIKKCDLFGIFITFRIKDEIEFKSMIGGVFTIFIYFFFFIIYYLLLDKFSRKEKY